MTLRPILLALLLAFGPALADETPTPNEQATMHSFAENHPDCVEWSDGCVICKRAMSVNCSTPGIACLPREIACKAP